MTPRLNGSPLVTPRERKDFGWTCLPEWDSNKVSRFPAPQCAPNFLLLVSFILSPWLSHSLKYQDLYGDTFWKFNPDPSIKIKVKTTKLLS